MSAVRDGLPYRFLRIARARLREMPFEKRAGSHVFRNGCDRFRDHDGNGSDEIVRVEEPLARLRQRCLVVPGYAANDTLRRGKCF